MKDVGWLSLAVLIAYGCAAVAPLLRNRPRSRAGVVFGWCFVPIVLSCPVLIFFPVDPGADATLGGMAATRASGSNAVR